MEDEYEFYMQNIGSVSVSALSKQDLRNLVATGESSFLEFKHKVASPEKIAREMWPSPIQKVGAFSSA